LEKEDNNTIEEQTKEDVIFDNDFIEEQQEVNVYKKLKHQTIVENEL
jgi:hypothetical protein